MSESFLGTTDEFNMKLGEHEFKEDIIKLHSFLFLFKHTINPRLSEEEEFCYSSHFRKVEFTTTKRILHADGNRVFNKALTHFITWLQSEDLQHELPSPGSAKSKGVLRFAPADQLKLLQMIDNASTLSKQLEKQPSDPSQPVSKIQVSQEPSQKSSHANGANTAVLRLMQDSSTHAKPNKQLKLLESSSKSPNSIKGETGEVTRPSDKFSMPQQHSGTTGLRLEFLHLKIWT